MQGLRKQRENVKILYFRYFEWQIPVFIRLIGKITKLQKYTAISRKVVGKSARDNPERCFGWSWVHCFSKKFQRMAPETMDVCLRVLKKSNKSRFDSYSVRKSALIISHITFRDCRVHSSSDNLSRNSCICGITMSRNDVVWCFYLKKLYKITEKTN